MTITQHFPHQIMVTRHLLAFLAVILLGSSFKLDQPAQVFHELMKEEQDISPSGPMLSLGHNVFDELTLYECSRHGGDCATYQALSALMRLGTENKDCTTDTDFPMCKIALEKIKKSLGEIEGEEIDVDSLYPLVLGEIIEDIPFLSGLFTALEKFICHKEGLASANCGGFKKVHNMYEKINSAAEEGRV